MLELLRTVALDLSPIRASRQFRALAAGEIVASLGEQAALVALPYQVYVTSRSPTLVGLLGAFELGPMCFASLLGGALNDRYDRRVMLAIAQGAVIVSAGSLCAASVIGRPPVLLVLILGGLLAGGVSLDGVTRAAIVPGVLGPEHLRSGLAFNYGVGMVTGIVGPALGGVVIASAGLATAYGIDAACCLATLAVLPVLGPQRPTAAPAEHPSVARSIAEGLRFVRANRALSGSFAIDLNAMTFGMPRALFAVLSLTVYHAGATGTGLLYAAVAAGGTLAVLTSGWVVHVRRLGRVVIYAVVAWGAAIACAGLVSTLAPAIGLLAVAGWADGISAVCRTTINQTVTPEGLRGRMSAVYILVVSGGPRLGDIESGVVAGLTSAVASLVIGGVACVAGVAAIVLTFPELAAFDIEAAPQAVGTGQGPRRSY